MIQNLVFQSATISALGQRIKQDWRNVDLELFSHSKMIENISSSIEIEMNNLKVQSKEGLKSDFNEEELRHYNSTVEDKYDEVSIHKEVYMNSLFIGIYSFYESNLLRFCEEYCQSKHDELENKKIGNESYIKFLFNIIKKTVDLPFDEIHSSFDDINNGYRTLRNLLIHSRYKCTENDIKKLTVFNNIKYINLGFRGNKRIIIENKEIISNFILKIRDFFEGLYIIFHNKILIDKNLT